MTRNKHPEDGTGVLQIVMKVIGVAITATVALVGAVSAYFNIIGKIDGLQRDLAQQADAIRSIKNLADEAVNANDLLAFCLKAQITNKGWVCPLASVETVKAPRRIVKSAVGQ